MEDICCSVVVPFFDEKDVAGEMYQRLQTVMDGTGESYELIFVDDGSTDGTREILEEICDADPRVGLLVLSRNFGHQIAISAGLDSARGNCVVTIDGDLQDSPEVIPDMLSKWRDGNDVVFGKRLRRKGESLFKRLTASLFYRLFRCIADVDIPVDSGDFRLIDRKVCDALKGMREKRRFVRGLVGWLGFKQTSVEYVREERFAGRSKFTFAKMLNLAFDSVVSFSSRPLRLASYAGALLALASFGYLIFVVAQRIFVPESTVRGWASLLAVSLMFNGIVLFMLGMIGEFVGRIYDEVRARPLYVVKETKNLPDTR